MKLCAHSYITIKLYNPSCSPELAVRSLFLGAKFAQCQAGFSLNQLAGLADTHCLGALRKDNVFFNLLDLATAVFSINTFELVYIKLALHLRLLLLIYFLGGLFVGAAL